MYVSPFAGYAVRVSYWLMQIVATGGHMVAVSIYMRHWFPGVPGAVWIVGFSAALVYVNSRAVASRQTTSRSAARLICCRRGRATWRPATAPGPWNGPRS